VGLHVVARYALFQIPGWVVVGGLAWGARDWFGISDGAALAVFALWVAKDVVLFPFVRKAYEPDGGGDAASALLGATGVAQEELAPRGYVRLRAELWRAELARGRPPVPAGGRVRVTGLRGLTLLVEPAGPEAE
jgi:membrane-bound serine protease (ClpP class)